MPSTATAPDLAATFAEQGYAVIRGLIPEATIQPVRDVLSAKVDRVLNEIYAKGLITDVAKDLPFERRMIAGGKHLNRYGRSWCDDFASPAVFDLHSCPALLAVLRKLLGPVVLGHRQFNLRPKLPGQDLTTVPWHQDSAYFGDHTKADTILTVWLPLVPVDENNGCMQVVPGSHRDGLRVHDTEATEAQFLKIRGEPDPDRVLSVPMVPGDALIFNNLMWHRSLPNYTDGIRWSIDLRYYPPTSPNADKLKGEFPQPWVLCGGEVTPVERWISYYSSSPWFHSSYR